MAKIGYGGQGKSKNYYLGNFHTREEAAAAYDASAREHHGAKAKLNFATPQEAELRVAAAELRQQTAATTNSLRRQHDKQQGKLQYAAVDLGSSEAVQPQQMPPRQQPRPRLCVDATNHGGILPETHRPPFIDTSPATGEFGSGSSSTAFRGHVSPSATKLPTPLNPAMEIVQKQLDLLQVCAPNQAVCVQCLQSVDVIG
jgi:hypothetical protein